MALVLAMMALGFSFMSFLVLVVIAILYYMNTISKRHQLGLGNNGSSNEFFSYVKSPRRANGNSNNGSTNRMNLSSSDHLSMSTRNRDHLIRARSTSEKLEPNLNNMSDELDREQDLQLSRRLQSKKRYTSLNAVNEYY